MEHKVIERSRINMAYQLPCYIRGANHELFAHAGSSWTSKSVPSAQTKAREVAIVVPLMSPPSRQVAATMANGVTWVGHPIGGGYILHNRKMNV